MIGIGQITHMYELLQSKKPDSELLNDNFWKLRDKMDDSHRSRILALIYNNKVEEAESILKQL